MNKICTTIEQSKKLIELGIDVNTADMTYLRTYFGEERDYVLLIDSYPEEYTENGDGSLIPVYDEHIPAWSLASLLSIIPKHIGDSVFRMDMGETDIALWFDDLSSGTVDEFLPDITKENFVDAAFETICWLKENGEI